MYARVSSPDRGAKMSPRIAPTPMPIENAERISGQLLFAMDPPGSNGNLPFPYETSRCYGACAGNLGKGEPPRFTETESSARTARQVSGKESIAHCMFVYGSLDARYKTLKRSGVGLFPSAP